MLIFIKGKANWIINIVVPGDSRTEVKEHKKVEKHQDLAR